MQKSIIVIVGITLSGKSTLIKALTKTTNLNQVITCTTRPPRYLEKQNVDYFFHQAPPKKNDPNVIAPRIYHVLDKSQRPATWYYWIDKHELDKIENPITILDYQGFLDLIRDLKGYQIHGIFLNVPMPVLLKRIHNKDRSHENIQETKRRLRTDQAEFSQASNHPLIKTINVTDKTTLQNTYQQAIKIINSFS